MNMMTIGIINLKVRIYGKMLKMNENFQRNLLRIRIIISTQETIIQDKLKNTGDWKEESLLLLHCTETSSSPRSEDNPHQLSKETGSNLTRLGLRNTNENPPILGARQFFMNCKSTYFVIVMFQNVYNQRRRKAPPTGRPLRVRNPDLLFISFCLPRVKQNIPGA